MEAISNGITAFKEPGQAGETPILDGLSSRILLLGITFLSYQIVAIPSKQETVISQLARTVFDSRNIFYFLTITGTTIILGSLQPIRLSRVSRAWAR